MLASFGALDRFTASGGKTIEKGCTTVDDGPDGPGCIVAAGIHPPRLGKTTWQRGDRFWVGTEDLPPAPDDLERGMGISGYPIVLGDGADLRIPMIHRWQNDRHIPNVPSSLQLGLRTHRAAHPPGVCRR